MYTHFFSNSNSYFERSKLSYSILFLNVYLHAWVCMFKHLKDMVECWKERERERGIEWGGGMWCAKEKADRKKDICLISADDDVRWCIEPPESISEIYLFSFLMGSLQLHFFLPSIILHTLDTQLILHILDEIVLASNDNFHDGIVLNRAGDLRKYKMYRMFVRMFFAFSLARAISFWAEPLTIHIRTWETKNRPF